MKNFRINADATLRYEGGLFIAEGKKNFNVVKISQTQALLLKHRSEQKLCKTFKEALAENQMLDAQPLSEGERYDGYVAVWKGGWLQACRLIGSLQIAKEPQDWIWADSQKKEWLAQGELLEVHTVWKLQDGSLFCGTFREVSAICGYWGDPYLQERKIGDRLQAAIKQGGIIQLEEKEAEELLKFSKGFTNGALILPC